MHLEFRIRINNTVSIVPIIGEYKSLSDLATPEFEADKINYPQKYFKIKLDFLCVKQGLFTF